MRCEWSSALRFPLLGPGPHGSLGVALWLRGTQGRADTKLGKTRLDLGGLMMGEPQTVVAEVEDKRGRAMGRVELTLLQAWRTPAP